MSNPSFRRNAAAVLLLTAVLTALPASAAGRPADAVSLSLSPMETLDRLWSFLRASINPNGQYKPGMASPPPAATKYSCGIDPDGQCKPDTTSPPPAQTKDGCSINPNGQCKP